MSYKIIVFVTACLAPCGFSVLEDVSQVFSNVSESHPIDRLDIMTIKRVASSSRYNFLLSPLGLKLVLCSLAEAAIGDTQEQLLSVLGIELDVFTRRKYNLISDYLKKNSRLPDFTYKLVYLGSWIFLSDDLVPRQRVVAIADQTYNTVIKTVNIRDASEAVKQIDSQVQNITDGLFHYSFNELDLMNAIILVLNTFDIDGYWKHIFFPEDTKLDKFYKTPTNFINVPFMHTTDYMSYAESTKFDAKIFGIDYAGNLTVYFIVPNVQNGLPRVLDNLNQLSTELSRMTQMVVDVILPKFKLDLTVELSGIMKDVGVQKPFQDTASFPGFGRNTLPFESIKVSRLMQRLEFGINEYGHHRAKIAAGGRGIKSPVNNVQKVVANRPFLVIVYDLQIKQLLLAGRIADPSNVESHFEVV